MMMMYQEAHYTAARVPHLSSLLLTYFRLKLGWVGVQGQVKGSG